MKSQSNKILELLRSKDWVCTSQMYSLYMADPRRRLCDLKERGFELESRKCQQHNYHKGVSKEWHLKVNIPKYHYIFDERRGVYKEIMI